MANYLIQVSNRRKATKRLEQSIEQFVNYLSNVQLQQMNQYTIIITMVRVPNMDAMSQQY